MLESRSCDIDLLFANYMERRKNGKTKKYTSSFGETVSLF